MSKRAVKREQIKRLAAIFCGILLSSSSLYSAEKSIELVQKDLQLPILTTNETQIIISDGTNSVTFNSGYRRAYINDTAVWLNGAARPHYKNVLMVSSDDVSRLIKPILYKPTAAVTNERPRIVFLDPGHGGDDGGAESIIEGSLEKDIALDISKRLDRYLKAAGMEVRYSRKDDTFKTLTERTELALEAKADIFISIHCNKAAGKSARGIETFTIAFESYDSTSADSRIAKKRRTGNTYDSRNSSLGYIIHSALPVRRGERDRGLRHARFQVLRNAAMPAILIECGFLSNEGEAAALASPRYREKLAEAIAQGIINYFEP